MRGGFDDGAGAGAGPSLIFAETTKIEAAPRFAIFEAWVPRTPDVRALAEGPQLS